MGLTPGQLYIGLLPRIVKNFCYYYFWWALTDSNSKTWILVIKVSEPLIYDGDTLHCHATWASVFSLLLTLNWLADCPMSGLHYIFPLTF